MYLWLQLLLLFTYCHVEIFSAPINVLNVPFGLPYSYLSPSSFWLVSWVTCGSEIGSKVVVVRLKCGRKVKFYLKKLSVSVYAQTTTHWTLTFHLHANNITYNAQCRLSPLPPCAASCLTGMMSLQMSWHVSHVTVSMNNMCCTMLARCQQLSYWRHRRSL